MSQSQNWYKADLREFRFLLFEQFHLDELLGEAPFADWGPDEVKMVLDECYRYATELPGPLNRLGDEKGCRLEDGQVKTIEEFKAVWKAVYEQGWRVLSVPVDLGGQGAPTTLQGAAEELMAGANPAFAMYPGLTNGAAELIAHHGTPEQVAQWAKPMFAGDCGGTMCLSEPQAGSDVGAATTTASPLGDGVYSIHGTKCWISAGDHGSRPTSRTSSSRASTAPRKLGAASASSSSWRSARRHAERRHRRGHRAQDGPSTASATCTLVFGDHDACHGYLKEGRAPGHAPMFTMMNYARIGVGIPASPSRAFAYLNALLDYAKDRKQGSSVEN
ncbi:MAG: acyl-CoA dehydrogenase family protein [Sandaracinaceae bacterium]